MNTSELLTTIAKNTDKVFNAGYSKCLKENPPGASEEELQSKYNEGLSEGREQGKAEGVEEGKKAEYDAFWDVFQNNGEPANYYYAFACGTFTDANYKPKYPILTTEGVTTATGTFYNSNITDIKVPFICKSTRLYQTFQTCTSLRRIPELNLLEATTFSNAFTQNYALEELNVTGTIGQSGFDIHWSTNLKTASIVSIIEALSPSEDVNGLSVTLPKTAVNNMVFPFTSERTGITYNSWSELEATRNKWTISLS